MSRELWRLNARCQNLYTSLNIQHLQKTESVRFGKIAAHLEKLVSSRPISFTVFAVVVPKCFIKHMCFIVLYFHGHAFFSQEIAKKCFFVLYFLKNVLYFCKFIKWVNIYFKFLFITQIGEL